MTIRLWANYRNGFAGLRRDFQSELMSTSERPILLEGKRFDNCELKRNPQALHHRLQSKKKMLAAVELLIHSLGYSGIGFSAHAVLTSAFTTSRASLLF